MILRILIFLLINFGALGLGSFFTSAGVVSDWYMELNKAPWTPPGWVFGAAWTLIMICFSVYMAKLWDVEKNTSFLFSLFGIQWVLNVMWNPIFFKWHNVALGLFTISALTMLIGCFFFKYLKSLKQFSLLILPYLLWLIIATSLNMYAFLNN